MVNIVDLERYVAGVVESEGGHVNEYEYFKAQAVLARTYALKNMNKHIKEGYNLKDDVSSQVFHGKCYLQNRINIYNAVEETAGLVLVDKNQQLILGAFHANSGGMTANSQDVWSAKLHYLQSKPDPYSLNQPASNWQKKIPAHEVLSWFSQQLKVQGDQSELQRVLSQYQQIERERQFNYNGRHVLLKEVRKRFKLRSTYFNIHLEGNFFVFEGFGNGHGVGLSQEGAMEMAKRGFCFEEILYFYFSEILLKDISTLK
jgi:stage II sporulation protein D